MVACAASPASGTSLRHHHYHHYRVGAPLSVPSVSASNLSAAAGYCGIPSMEGAHPRGSSCASSSALLVTLRAEDGDDNNVQILRRLLSGSRLNAGAPAFVPKDLQISCSTSLPGLGQSFGFSPPGLVQTSSSVTPVIIPLPPAKETVGADVFVPAVFEKPMLKSLPNVDVGSAKDVADGADVFAAPDRVGEIEAGQRGAESLSQSAKPVVTEELKTKVLKQVEFYFSDANLSTDNYLMKFVKKDPEGFVPIPVVGSFRKIKNLVKNHGVVAAILRNSTQLVVSEDGKKVRRTQPLADMDQEEVQSRTVVAENLPANHSVESMEELFGKVGPVRMVRICCPETANGANSTAAKHSKADMLVSVKLHALVEYESVELAEKAVAELTDERNWRSGLRVRLLLRRQTFQSKHSYQQVSHQRAHKGGADTEVAMDEELSVGEKGHGREEYSGWHHHGERIDDFTGFDGGDAVGKKGRGRGRGGRTGRSRGLPHYQPHSGISPQNSVYVGSDTVGKPPPGPRMPDGTRGFSAGRGNLLAVYTCVVPFNTVA